MIRDVRTTANDDGLAEGGKHTLGQVTSDSGIEKQWTTAAGEIEHGVTNCQKLSDALPKQMIAAWTGNGNVVNMLCEVRKRRQHQGTRFTRPVG